MADLRFERTIMKEVEVIGAYQYPERKAFRIGRDITDMTREMGFKPLVDPYAKHHRKAAWFNEALHAEVRLTAPSKGEDLSWHQDSDFEPEAITDCALILWAEETPTEFKLSSGDIYQPEPFEIVYARNALVMHRRPSNAPFHRASFRQRVERWITV